MKFNAMDIIVSDVPDAVAFFRDVLGLQVMEEYEQYASIDTGAVKLMLSPSAMIDVENAGGVILHFQVANVESEIQRLRGRGATVLLEPTSTDWGTEMAMIEGPEGLIVELYRHSD